MANKASQEGVIIIFDGETPAYMVRKNGEVQYYKLVEMGFGDHAELWGADAVSK